MSTRGATLTTVPNTTHYVQTLDGLTSLSTREFRDVVEKVLTPPPKHLVMSVLVELRDTCGTQTHTRDIAGHAS